LREYKKQARTQLCFESRLQSPAGELGILKIVVLHRINVRVNKIQALGLKFAQHVLDGVVHKNVVVGRPGQIFALGMGKPDIQRARQALVGAVAKYRILGSV